MIDGLASNGAASNAPGGGANDGWLVRYRAALYPIANVVVWVASIAGAAVHDIPFGVVIYVDLLFGLCSAPLLFMRRINDRYALLALFMVLYFLFSRARLADPADRC